MMELGQVLFFIVWVMCGLVSTEDAIKANLNLLSWHVEIDNDLSAFKIVMVCRKRRTCALQFRLFRLELKFL